MKAMLASAFARKDHYRVVTTTARVLQLGFVLGTALTVLLGLGMQFGAGVFTKDAAVIKTIHKAVPVLIKLLLSSQIISQTRMRCHF